MLVLSLFVFLLATPLFAFGIWFQTEPVTVGLLGVGAAAGLCLLALDWTGHAVAPLFTRRHVQILLAFLLWNAATSLPQTFSGRGWFGTPETGEGIFSFLALFMLLLLAMVLWPYRRPRLVLVGAAAASALALGAMDGLLPLDSSWRPQKYAGYAGTVGPPVALILVGAVRRAGWKTLLAAGLIGLAPVAFSANKTAIALYCLGGPAALGVMWALRWPVSLAPARRLLAWSPLVALLLTGAVIAAAVAYGDYDPLYSVRSRGLLLQAAWFGLRADPWALLTGFGWGSFNDILYQHTFLPGVRGFVDGVWDPNWEGVGAGGFHVHDDVIEAVLGGGVPGGILYLMYFITLVAGARRAMLGLAAVGWFLIVGSLCFWYPFLLSLPFLALAAAATTVPLGVLGAGTAAPLAGWARGIGLGLVALLGLGALMTAEDALTGGARLAALNRQNAADIPAFGAFPPDHGRGGVHLWWLALNEAHFIGARVAAGQPVTADQARWFERLLDEVDRWVATGRAGVRLEALALALRNDLAAWHEQGTLAPLRDRELPRWEGALMRVIRHSPERADVAVPFMAFLVLTRQYSRIIGTCAAIAEAHPNDVVCQWYTGIARLADPQTVGDGLLAMRTALARGVDAVVPVPQAARALVEANAPPVRP